MPLLPTVLWAQRSDKLYLTIDIQDVKDQTYDLQDEKLSFSGKGGSQGSEYSLDLQFFAAIDASSEDSKVSVTPRNIFMIIKKKESGHWPRLTKESGKHLSHIKCDWDKWVDEDEEDEKPEADFSGMDFSNFGGMGGMGGMMGGMGGMGGMMGGMGGMGGLGGMMGGMGGMGGLGDMDFGAGDEGPAEEGEGEDSDNEELPDLVKP